MAQPTAAVYVELRALTAKFEQGMNSAVSSVLGVEKRLTNSFNTINKVMQAALVIGGVVAVKKLGDALGALAERGEIAGSIAENFEKLGGSSSAIENARGAVLGMVDSFELMRIASDGLLKEIPDLNKNFASMAEYAGKFADASGRDTKEVLEEITKAIGKAATKKLNDVGVTLIASEAYQTYANKVGKLVKELTDSEKKLAMQEAAFAKIIQRNKELAPLTDSVANAYASLGAAVDEGIKKFSIAINSSEDLRLAYRDLEEQLKQVDWAALGKQAAAFFSGIVSIAREAIQVVKDLSWQFNKLFGDGLDAQQSRSNEKIMDLQKQIQNAPNGYRGTTTDSLKAKLKEEEENFKRITLEMMKYKKTAEQTKQPVQDLSDSQKGIALTADEARDRLTKQGDTLSKQAEKIKKAKEEAEKYAEAWAKLTDSSSQSSLEKQIDNAIESMNSASFQELKGKLSDSIQSGFVKEWQDAIKSGAVSFDAVKERGKLTADEVTTELQKKLDDKLKDSADRAKEEFKDVFDSVADSLSSALSEISPQLADIVSGFGKLLGDETKAGIVDSISKGLGISSKELGSYAQGAVKTLEAAFNAKSTDKATKSNAGTGAAIGAGIGTYFGGAAGAQIGNAIGSMIGGAFKWGAQNPQTQARHAFANFIEEGFAKLKQVSFYDAQGKLKSFQGDQLNFLEGGSGRFNDKDWTKGMDAWSSQAKQTFLGLGEALEEMLGLTEDVGAQIGFLLGENLNGNLDNARLLVQQLGLSFEDMEEQLVSIGKSGEMSWLEVESAIQGAADAFKPGRAAAADTLGALNSIIDSGGRGVAAIKGVRDTAVEAMEAGVKTIDQLGQDLISKGANPEIINSYIAAIKGRGLKSLEELANASDRVAGGIVADLASSNKPLRDQWEQMKADVEALGTTINNLPTSKDVEINVRTNFDGNTEKFLSGELSQVNSPPTNTGGLTSGVQKRSNTNMNINVDARGSAAGVGAEVKRSIMELEPYLTAKAVNKVQDVNRRGGSGSNSLR